MGEKWKVFDSNFEHIFKALETLFVLSSLEGWPKIMFQIVDGNSSDIGPLFEN